MPVSSSPPDEGDDAPRQTHNFAPTYRGLVYRAYVPDDGEGERGGGEEAREVEERHGGEKDRADVAEGEHEKEGGGQEKEVQYKLQTMKWG
ncbi:hypothetical protein V493_07718 [Pseudogymnoascus sp. VKM F-4281 (FW-2241)]|nr:hypothetical protein V493_07718 [Pseudogymnoascus sp. VKM F-4281 (FW-2241)]